MDRSPGSSEVIRHSHRTLVKVESKAVGGIVRAIVLEPADASTFAMLACQAQQRLEEPKLVGKASRNRTLPACKTTKKL